MLASNDVVIESDAYAYTYIESFSPSTKTNKNL